MSELAASFETHRSHLRNVAYRMLGSTAEADDAVQEAWLKLSRAETGAVENLRAWLTTVVARTCLDLLRSRTARREDPIAEAPEQASSPIADRELADSVGLAALVVLDNLEPAERIAFVLHDLCAMSFDDIAPIVSRTPAAARQLASRARRRVQGASAPEIDVATQRRVVDAFIAALRAGDVEALVAVLGGNREWAQGASQWSKAAVHMKAILVDGRIGLTLAPGGTIQRVLVLDYKDATILSADVITEAEAIAELAIQELT